MSDKVKESDFGNLPGPGPGRNSLYREEYDQLVHNYCLIGATDKQLAELFDVSESTVDNWKLKHSSFLGSLKAGKAVADAAVARALFERALGYSHPDVRISNHQGNVIVTEITKHYPPDTTAMIFWLKNRQPALWGDKTEHKHSGSLSIKQMLDEIDGQHIQLPPQEEFSDPETGLHIADSDSNLKAN